jgi:uncharacterized protein (TIGR00369 family)
MDGQEQIHQSIMGKNFDPKLFVELFSQHSHNGLIGTQYVGHGDDWIELAIDYNEKLVGDPETGILASGPIVSLCDMASGASIWLHTKKFMLVVTIDLRVDYLRPAKVGERVTARMTCYRATRSVAFVRGSAHDGDPTHPIAQATGTFMLLDETSA